MLLPLQGECVQLCCSRGAATLCPGLCACCLFKAPSFFMSRTHLHVWKGLCLYVQ